MKKLEIIKIEDESLYTLKDKNVKATFFITGDFVKRFPELVIRISQEGHLACNHSYSHKKITSLTKDELNKNNPIVYITKSKRCYHLSLNCPGFTGNIFRTRYSSLNETNKICEKCLEGK